VHDQSRVLWLSIWMEILSCILDILASNHAILDMIETARTLVSLQLATFCSWILWFVIIRLQNFVRKSFSRRTCRPGVPPAKTWFLPERSKSRPPNLIASPIIIHLSLPSHFLESIKGWTPNSLTRILRYVRLKLDAPSSHVWCWPNHLSLRIQ
jgi:hypothetical protein